MLNSEEELEEFDLRKFDESEECLLRLLPVARVSRKIVVSDSGIKERGCTALLLALKSNPSHLRELNMNYSDPGESGVKVLSDLLEDPHCKLEKLQLECCSITEEGCAALVSALKSNPSHLRELNLNKNNPGESGVKLLSDLLQDPHCKLEKLLLSECSITEEGCGALVSALKSNPSHLRELSLDYSRPGESAAKLLSDLLEDSRCKLEKLELEFCSITERGCAALVSALNQNPSHLRELNLNYNKPGESGVKLLSDLLKDPHYKLEKLQISDYSQLTELDLNGKKIRDSQVQSICDLLEDPDCKLEKVNEELPEQLHILSDPYCSGLFSEWKGGQKHLWMILDLDLYNCRITEKGCAALVSALKSNPSHLRELNLSLNKPGESEVKLLSDLLKDPHCKLEKLQLCWCNLTKRSCAVLSPALSSNSSSLRELNLSNNELQDEGVKLLSAALKNPHCKLEKLDGVLPPEAGGSAHGETAVNVEVAPPEEWSVLPASAVGELAEAPGVYGACWHSGLTRCRIYTVAGCRPAAVNLLRDEHQRYKKSDSGWSLSSQEDTSSTIYNADEIKAFLQRTKGQKLVQVAEFILDWSQFVHDIGHFRREKAFTELELYWLKNLLTRLRKKSTDDGQAMG
ncbi:hypothetical protein NFI96_004869 [Prochilodus magdalenae]|nr:hypothetical protein NFI96_004869 [Prochilodus magdalenae]